MKTPLCVTIALLAMFAGPAAAQVTTWRVDGNTRQALVFAPSTATTGPALPLVFAFHGRGDDVQNYQYVHLHVAWRDAIVVYFQGLERDGLSGWQTEPGQDRDRDLKLVDVALASLREKYRIDDDRVYATGFSNGAGFTYLLWAERPQVFAAYAVVAGRLRPSVQPKQPRPLLAIAGERDPQITFPDQKAAMTQAIAVNSVRAGTTRCGAGCTIYGAGTPAPVVTVIHPGGHEYPRGTSERIVAFFRDHARTR